MVSRPYGNSELEANVGLYYGSGLVDLTHKVRAHNLRCASTDEERQEVKKAVTVRVVRSI